MSQPSVFRWARGLKQFWKQRESVGKDTVKFIGKDHKGNSYYEAFRPNNIRQNQRFFERPKVQSFDDVVDAAHVPPPWDAWLRFRRQEPPTDEEVQDSEEYFRMQQEMAAKKKAQRQGEGKQDVVNPYASQNVLTKARRVPPGQYET